MVSRREIEEAQTPKGGWTREQLAEWGVEWPPTKGWKKRLIARSRAPKEIEVIEPWNPTKRFFTLRVEKQEDGTWSVLDADGAVLASGMSNAQAWRRLDIISNEPLNKRQDTADWSASQTLKGR